jgi:hypothetical protein
MAPRDSKTGYYINQEALEGTGLSRDVLENSIHEVNDLMDSVDQALLDHGVERLSQIVELANLSSMLGNVFAAAVAKHSNGVMRRNGPHKYPDLLSNMPNIPDIEVKVALETNKPKGHLIKTGRYLTCRYVLCDETGVPQFDKSNRGKVPWIWEVRCGVLEDHHFTVSNTEGDSGKTAVVNKDGMDALTVVYVDTGRLPYSERSRIRKDIMAMI